MRVRLNKFDLNKLFLSVAANKKMNWSELARKCSVTTRTLRDWRNGVITIPEKEFKYFLSVAKMQSGVLTPKIEKDFWHIGSAARSGGLAYFKKYGSPATLEGRRKGGAASIATHIVNHTGFKTLKSVSEPKKSEDLAELMGIMIGDGHLSDFQASITTNSETDMEHALFAKALLTKLFALPVGIALRKKEHAVNIVLSSKNVVQFLNKFGMPLGNKLKSNLSVPMWVVANFDYKKAFIRGLFDTDGCVYLDKHWNNGKLYKHLGWTITSYAPTLVKGILEILSDLGFRPTYSPSQKSVFLRRGEEVRRFFSSIGTHNVKHRRRFDDFINVSK